MNIVRCADLSIIQEGHKVKVAQSFSSASGQAHPRTFDS